MRFAVPLLLWLLLLAPAAAALADWLWRRRLDANAAWAARGLWDRLLPAYAPRRLRLSVATLAVAVLGTSLALASGAARLKASPAKTKIIVLVTDGVNNSGAIDPASAAALCKGLGIKVYTIGVGSAGRVPVPLPVQDPVTGETVTRRYVMNVPVDEPLMRQIAQRTGGHFYRATDRESLQRIFQQIDRLEKTPLQVKRYVRYREAYPPLVWAGLGLLLLPLAAAGLKVTAEP